MNHNKRFHAAFDQVEKGHKRKPKEEVLPYDVPLLKLQKQEELKEDMIKTKDLIKQWFNINLMW